MLYFNTKKTLTIDEHRAIIKMIDLGVKHYEYIKSYKIDTSYMSIYTIYVLDDNKFFKASNIVMADILVLNYRTKKILCVKYAANIELRLVDGDIIGVSVSPSKMEIEFIFTYNFTTGVIKSINPVKYHNDTPEWHTTSPISMYLIPTIKCKLIYSNAKDWRVYKQICNAKSLNDIIEIEKANIVQNYLHGICTAYRAKQIGIFTIKMTQYLDRNYIEVSNNSNTISVTVEVECPSEIYDYSFNDDGETSHRLYISHVEETCELPSSRLRILRSSPEIRAKHIYIDY